MNVNLSAANIAQLKAGTSLDLKLVPPAASAPKPTTSGLWRPPNAGKQTFGLVAADWAKLIGTVRPEGTATGLASKIPCPGGHLDWEYGNPERQYYLDPSEGSFGTPFSIGPEGEMVITAKNAPTPNAGQDYLSGALATAGVGGTLFSQGYGYFTSRLKWALLPGMWPAFWFLSLDNNFTYGLELDFENWQNMVNSVHCGIANSGDGGAFFPVADVSNWHVYGVDYRADFVMFFCDGVLLHKYPTPPNCIGKTIFPIWNVAVGRDNSWAGTPPAVAGSSMSLHLSQFAAFA